MKIGGCDVFQMNHEEAKEVVRKAGNQLSLVVERGEKIVPSMNTAFPKPKEETVEKPKSYSQVVFIVAVVAFVAFVIFVFFVIANSVSRILALSSHSVRPSVALKRDILPFVHYMTL